MNDFYIRRATPADVALIATISRETFYNAYAAFNTKANMDKYIQEYFTNEKLVEELNLPDNIFLLAYENNNVAGYAKIRDKATPLTSSGTDNALEIARFYTSTDMIGKGIGSKLMKRTISIAEDLKREFIWLDVWKENTKAVKFYERFGFKKFSDYTFILGDDMQDDWLMKKKL